ncbi:MAG: peptidase domain-containing ABC transporter [Planctomycetota bacterium]
MTEASAAEPHDHPPAWRRYFSFLQPEAADLWSIVVFGIASAVLSLAAPLTVDALVSSILFGAMLTPLVVLTLVLLGCLLLNGALRGLQVWAAEVIERRMLVRVAADLSWRLPRVQISAFDERHGPEQVNRFFDTITLQKSSTKLVLAVTNVVLQTAVGMTVLAFYHPFLLILVLALVGAVAVIVFGFGWRGTRTAIAESIAKYDIAAWLQELARHTTAFCTKGGANFAAERTDELCRRYIEARRRHFRIWFRQFVGSVVVQVAAATAVLGVGGWLVIEQQLTPGQLVASELIVSAVASNLVKVADVLKDWYDACASADKLGHLVDLPLERQDGDALPSTDKGVAIELRGLVCAAPGERNGRRVFELSVRPGERIALVGSTGGAASNVLDALFGLREPLGGTTVVDGLDLRQLRLDATRDDFALVHGTEIVEGTVLENLCFGRGELSPQAVRDALSAAGLWEEVLSLPHGLDTRLTTRGGPLSSSQASRLMLARAIVRSPRLLMLDGAIDVLTKPMRALVLRNLFDRRRPWTILVVTQEDDVVAACDRAIDCDTAVPSEAGR